MSIETAIVKLQSSLKIFGLPDLQQDIPDEVMSLLPPQFYIEEERENYEFGALQATFVTRSYSICRGILTWHSDKVEPGKTLKGMLRMYGRQMRDKLIADTIAGVFEQDGDKGFRAELQEIIYHIRPNDPIGAIVFRISISQYT